MPGVPSAGWREVYAALDVDPDAHESPDDLDRNGRRSGEGQSGRSPMP